MTLDEARRIVGAYQARKAQATPDEYMRYMAAKQVLADHGLLELTPGQRGLLASVRRQLSIGEDA